MTQWLNYLANHEAVCRTAPATPGLLKTKAIFVFIWNSRTAIIIPMVNMWRVISFQYFKRTHLNGVHTWFLCYEAYSKLASWEKDKYKKSRWGTIYLSLIKAKYSDFRQNPVIFSKTSVIVRKLQRYLEQIVEMINEK